MIAEIIRYIGARVFGVRYVELIDYNGARHVRRVEFQGGKAFSRRYGFDIANVLLLDNGKTAGVSYVHGWEPHEPMSKPVWPKWEASK
jgi:hypothetical protein